MGAGIRSWKELKCSLQTADYMGVNRKWEETADCEKLIVNRVIQANRSESIPVSLRAPVSI